MKMSEGETITPEQETVEGAEEVKEEAQAQPEPLTPEEPAEEVAEDKPDEPFGSVIVKKKVRSYIKSQGMNVGAGFYSALNDEVTELIDKAIRRTKEFKYSTVTARSL